MELSTKICYQALVSHDHRFDGVFFTCVTSTGIYCRTICPAIVPKQENCRFTATAAEAEKAGYRPCLRCRPEYAPADTKRGEQSLAHKLALYIDETLLIDETLSSVAAHFKVSERHLRRKFTELFGVEPKQYLTTRRLLFAKQLLQDTSLPIANIAYAAGFNTPARLTINMQKAYGFTPQRFRKNRPSESLSKPIILRTDYRPPFSWEALLGFITARATPLEWVNENTYYRLADGYEVVIQNKSNKNHLTIQIPLELSHQAHTIISKTRALFDLDANPSVIEGLLSDDPYLCHLIDRYPGMRVPGSWDSFEMVLRAIIGQQVSVAGATTIMRRLVEQVGITPTAIALSSPAAIATVGMPLKRASTIHGIGQMVHEGKLNLSESDPKKFYASLIAIAGIGPWTAEYLCMRVLHWPDALPAGDLGLQKAIEPGMRQTEQQVIARAEAWRPWRSYATVLLWKSLENQGG